MYDDAMPEVEAWEDFPAIGLDQGFDPFRRPLLGGSATTIKLFRLAQQASGATALPGLNDRLSAVANLAASGIETARANRVPAMLGLLPVTPEHQPGLAFVLLSPEDHCSLYPAHELYASLALWILWESHKAMMVDPVRGLALEVQASLCLLFAAGEGGYLLGQERGVERQRRWLSEKNRIGAVASHREQNQRWTLLLAEFDKGRWKSKSAAAELLAVKYSFETGTVLKKLYKVRKSKA